MGFVCLSLLLRKSRAISWCMTYNPNEHHLRTQNLPNIRCEEIRRFLMTWKKQKIFSHTFYSLSTKPATDHYCPFCFFHVQFRFLRICIRTTMDGDQSFYSQIKGLMTLVSCSNGWKCWMLVSQLNQSRHHSKHFIHEPFGSLTHIFIRILRAVFLVDNESGRCA